MLDPDNLALYGTHFALLRGMLVLGLINLVAARLDLLSELVRLLAFVLRLLGILLLVLRLFLGVFLSLTVGSRLRQSGLIFHSGFWRGILALLTRASLGRSLGLGLFLGLREKLV